MIPLIFTIVIYSIAPGFTKVMEVTQPPFITVKRREAAHFVCEYKNAGYVELLKVTLLKEAGNESAEICASSVNTGTASCSLKGGSRCQIYPYHEKVNVVLLGMQPNDSGLYVCKIEQIYPPPYYPVKGKGTQLYVIDTDLCPDTHLWIFAIVASGLLGYSLLITIFIMKGVIRRTSYFTPGSYEKTIPM